jgi:N-acetylated-alpha-linked acidic dipeptidase
MKRPALSLLTAALALAAPAVHAAEPPIYGFSAAHAVEQRALEARFDSFLAAEDQRAWMQRLTARPHAIGSPYGKENAEFMAGLFRSWGFDTRIEEFRVLFPTPRLRRLEMIAPSRFTAGLTEPPIPEDRTSGQTSEQLPIYNAWSADGDVTADLVYANFGRPQDYADLERRGIDVKGKIVLVRYGGGFRGMKPKLAADHGAAGCIIFSDPGGFGFFQGDPYPLGGWLPDQGAQRGSVADLTHYSGDPLTPFVGAVPTLNAAQRLAREDAPAIARIPVLPISAADALPLLAALGGAVAPEDWRGHLPTTYHLGPGPARVHLELAFDWRMVTAYDVIARLAGAERPEQWILRGNHHDAWVNGASDPVSALVALLAEAKGVGELAAHGWRPKRTIVYAAWDGEEPGLLGAVEWAETHAAELSEHLAAYVNSDGNARGTVYTSGVATLTTLVDQVYDDVVDPEKQVSVAARLRAVETLYGSPDEQRLAAEGRPLPLKPFSVGTDYTPFLAYLGVPALDIGYGGEEEYGVYHSIYDSFDHFNRFVDPGFRYGVALAQTAGRIVLRLAEADVLPFDFVPLAESLQKAVQRLDQSIGALREETAETNRRIADRTYELADDPLHPVKPPQAEGAVPPLDLAPLQKAAAHLSESARAYAPALERAQELDRILLQAERELLRPAELPGRPWYRHQLYGPSAITGTMVLFPAVRNAVDRRDWQAAAAEIAVAARVIESYARQVDRLPALAITPGQR